MSLMIEGAPAYVLRSKIDAFLADIGVDPADLCCLTVRDPMGIEIEVFASDRVDVPGHRWTHDGKNVATHRLTIPIVDKEPT